MATLGIWFIGLGVANAILGGIAVRITDPMIRGLVLERFLGFPLAVWLALVGARSSPMSSRTIPASAATSTRSAAARTWRRSPASRSRACRIAAFTLAGTFYGLAGVLAAAQLGLGNAQIGDGRLFTRSPPSWSAAPRSPAAKAACCNRWSAC